MNACREKIVGTSGDQRIEGAADPKPALATGIFLSVFFIVLLLLFRQLNNYIEQGELMARKRINGNAPLTAAEKQKRYREKKAAEEKQEDDRRLERMREVLIEDLYKLSLEEMRALIKKIYSPSVPDMVSLEELSEMTGISKYELKKLEAQGVIKPSEDNGLADIGLDLGFLGLTEDEFIRFVRCVDDDNPKTTKEIFAAAEIPLHKAERVERIFFGKKPKTA